jgi:hypothetical protein
MLTMAKVDPMVPFQMARLCRDIMVVRSVNPPVKTPEAPNPVTARPTMSACELGASAHMTLPSSKTNK